jgi:hypothetical protein
LEEAERVYIHSLYNFVKILPAGKPRGARFIWDIHGLVGEEMLFLGKPFVGRLLLRLEPVAVRLTDGMVHVTRAMQSHYTEKYPAAHSVRHLVHPIARSNALGNPRADLEARELVQEKGWEGKTLFLYSGNAQKWQNTDLMLERFSRLDPSRNHLVVLTGEPEVFTAKVRSRGLANCTIRSFPPEELAPWYEAAHYGFLLRDDHPLNRVASPTKMAEYLFFGIVPVVKFEGIGDFSSLGYEFLPLDRLAGNLPPRKSRVNREIGRRLLSATATGPLRDFVEQCCPPGAGRLHPEGPCV